MFNENGTSFLKRKLHRRFPGTSRASKIVKTFWRYPIYDGYTLFDLSPISASKTSMRYKESDFKQNQRSVSFENCSPGKFSTQNILNINIDIQLRILQNVIFYILLLLSSSTHRGIKTHVSERLCNQNMPSLHTSAIYLTVSTSPMQNVVSLV